MWLRIVCLRVNDGIVQEEHISMMYYAVVDTVEVTRLETLSALKQSRFVLTGLDKNKQAFLGNPQRKELE